MKKHLLLLLLLAMTAVAHAALSALHIHTSTHGVITLLLDDEPTLTFNDDRSITVEVTNPEAETEPVRLSFDDIESCEYGQPDDYTELSVDTPDANLPSSITVQIDATGVTFGNIPDGSPVEIFNISGMCLRSEKAGGGIYTLCRNDFHKGIYIVRIGKFTTKVSL